MGWKELGGEVITYGVEEGEEVEVEAWMLGLGRLGVEVMEERNLE